jgi:Ca2+-binding EF-hand superfamily protein
LVEAKSKSKKPKPAKITILPVGMVRGMDLNRDQVITSKEFLDYRAQQFDPKDKNGDGFLDANEFSHPKALKGSDKNKDGKLSREEHLNIFRSQFPNVDVNKDGKITAADKRKK